MKKWIGLVTLAGIGVLGYFLLSENILGNGQGAGPVIGNGQGAGPVIGNVKDAAIDVIKDTKKASVTTNVMGIDVPTTFSVPMSEAYIQSETAKKATAASIASFGGTPVSRNIGAAYDITTWTTGIVGGTKKASENIATKGY